MGRRPLTCFGALVLGTDRAVGEKGALAWATQGMGDGQTRARGALDRRLVPEVRCLRHAPRAHRSGETRGWLPSGRAERVTRPSPWGAGRAARAPRRRPQRSRRRPRRCAGPGAAAMVNCGGRGSNEQRKSTRGGRCASRGRSVARRCPCPAGRSHGYSRRAPASGRARRLTAASAAASTRPGAQLGGASLADAQRLPCCSPCRRSFAKGANSVILTGAGASTSWGLSGRGPL